ncbi:MAG: hypothetical protein ACFWTY_05055 [Shouchella clausii]
MKDHSQAFFLYVVGSYSLPVVFIVLNNSSSLFIFSIWLYN